jgi:hypothetical protein
VREELARWRNGQISTEGDIIGVVALEMWLRALDNFPRRSGVPHTIGSAIPTANADSAPELHAMFK